jgi:hypothetical protein
MSYSDLAADTMTWFATRLEEQRAAHDGHALRRWADVVVDQLPAGPLVLLAASTEGCVLAGVVASMRGAATAWERLDLGQDDAPDLGVRRVVVEPALLAPGLLQVIERRLPDASVIHGLASTAAPARAAA